MVLTKRPQSSTHHREDYNRSNESPNEAILSGQPAAEKITMKSEIVIDYNKSHCPKIKHDIRP